MQEELDEEKSKFPDPSQDLQKREKEGEKMPSKAACVVHFAKYHVIIKQ